MRCKPLDLWFKHFPLLGNEMFYVLMVPYLLWFGPDNGGAGRRFTLMTWPVTTLSPPARVFVAFYVCLGGAPPSMSILVSIIYYFYVLYSEMRCCNNDGVVGIQRVVCFLNNFWKEIFKLPRPPKRLHVNAAESEVSKHTVVQPGFPSTHSAHVSEKSIFI